MKVLLIKPMEHPQVVDIENSLEEFYRILDCDCITATYPWYVAVMQSQSRMR